MELRSMEALERDRKQNNVNDWSRACHQAITAGHASDAAAFARAAIRASRQLAQAEQRLSEAQAEPMLRLVGREYVGEIARAYSDDRELQADMLSELREVA